MRSIVIEIAPREAEDLSEMMRKAHNLLQSELKGWFSISSKVVETVDSETISH